MIRVVLDTNIIISAALVEDGFPAMIVSLALNKQIQMYLSNDIYQEYCEVFNRPRFKNKLKKSQKYLNALKKASIFVKPVEKLSLIKSDPTDNKLLECAKKAHAHFLITGNTKHFNFAKYQNTVIISPKDFIETIS